MLGRNQFWNEWPLFGQSFESFDELRREMDRLLFDFGRGFRELGQASSFAARVALKDNGSAFVLRSELPGLTEKDVEISANANTVTIRAERKVHEPEGYSAHRRERQGFVFARTFELPAKIDPDAIEAVMKNGVLTLSLPKAPDAQPKRIAVKAS